MASRLKTWMLIVGVVLIIFPEPATTATGLAIVGASFGVK